MSIPSSTRRLATAGAVAAAIAACAAPSALAGSDESIDFKGGQVSFQDDGELLIAEDQLADGYGVRAYLLAVGTSTATARGKGDRAVKNLDIYEGAKVLLKGCLIDKRGRQVRCTQFQKATA
jgi:hypothetical protein